VPHVAAASPPVSLVISPRGLTLALR
jgi:hypothetical protein